MPINKEQKNIKNRYRDTSSIGVYHLEKVGGVSE